MGRVPAGAACADCKVKKAKCTHATTPVSINKRHRSGPSASGYRQSPSVVKAAKLLQTQSSHGNGSGSSGSRKADGQTRRHAFQSPVPPSRAQISAKSVRLRENFFREDMSVKLPAWVLQENHNHHPIQPVAAVRNGHDIRQLENDGLAQQFGGGGGLGQGSMSIGAEHGRATHLLTMINPGEDTASIRQYNGAVAAMAQYNYSILRPNMHQAVQQASFDNRYTIAGGQNWQSNEPLEGGLATGSSIRQLAPIIDCAEPSSNKELNHPLPKVRACAPPPVQLSIPFIISIDSNSDVCMDEQLAEPQPCVSSSSAADGMQPTGHNNNTPHSGVMELDWDSDGVSDDEIRRPQFSSPFLRVVLNDPPVRYTAPPPFLQLVLNDPPAETWAPITNKLPENRGDSFQEKLEVGEQAVTTASPTQPVAEAPLNAEVIPESTMIAGAPECNGELETDKPDEQPSELAPPTQEEATALIDQSLVAAETSRASKIVKLGNEVSPEEQKSIPVPLAQLEIEASIIPPAITLEVHLEAEMVELESEIETRERASRPSSPDPPTFETSDTVVTTEISGTAEIVDYECELGSETKQPTPTLEALPEAMVPVDPPAIIEKISMAPEVIEVEVEPELGQQLPRPASPTQPNITEQAGVSTSATKTQMTVETVELEDGVERVEQAPTPTVINRPAPDTPNSPPTTGVPNIPKTTETNDQVEPDKHALTEAPLARRIIAESFESLATLQVPIVAETVTSHIESESEVETEQVTRPLSPMEIMLVSVQKSRLPSPMDIEVEPPVLNPPPIFMTIDSDSDLESEPETEPEADEYPVTPPLAAESPVREPTPEHSQTPQPDEPKPQTIPSVDFFSPVFRPVQPRAPVVSRFKLGDTSRWRNPERTRYNRFSGPAIITPLRAAPIPSGLGDLSRAGWPQHEGSWRQAHDDLMKRFGGGNNTD